MPPSVLADGRGYCWAKTGANTFANAPAWLTEAALPPPLPPRVAPRPLDGDVEAYVAAAVASELTELDRAPCGARNDALNRASYSLAGFVLAGALPEDWARSQLETRAVGLGLSIIEARGTISSGFNAAQARELPR